MTLSSRKGRVATMKEDVSSSQTYGTGGLPQAMGRELMTIWNARRVDFVASPENTHTLFAALRETVAPLLAEHEGFGGMIILISEKEPRLISVLSLWSTKTDAANWKWEEEDFVRDALLPLVDRWRAQTLQAYWPVPYQRNTESDGL
jgi:hypothetical protein